MYELANQIDKDTGLFITSAHCSGVVIIIHRATN